MGKNFLKVKEAAEAYGIGKDAFYKAIRKRELKAYKPNGRDFLLKATEIEQWIESKVVQVTN